MKNSKSVGELSTTSYALLGLLGVKAWTTYELTKQVQRSLGWFWPRTERKLYDEPRRLVAAGFATATEQYTGKRPRTVYAITTAGRTALRRWLGEPPEPPALEFEAMVKVFFADGATLTELRATLDQVLTSATERHDELRSMIAASQAGPYEFAGRLPINALALRFQLDHETLQINWAKWARTQIATWNSPTDPNGWDPCAPSTDVVDDGPDVGTHAEYLHRMTELATDPELDPVADEGTTLVMFLDYYRSVLVRKVEGITETQARITLAPSELTLLGLVRHMAEVERTWFRRRFMGIDCAFLYCGDASSGGDPDGDFHPTDADTIDEALHALHGEIDFARAATLGRPMDALAQADQPLPRIPGWRPSLRWILVHMIEEYARHCGHADLLREAADGSTGD